MMPGFENSDSRDVDDAFTKPISNAIENWLAHIRGNITPEAEVKAHQEHRCAGILSCRLCAEELRNDERGAIESERDDFDE